MVATPPPKQPGEAGHVPPVPLLETQGSCYNCTIAFPSPLNLAPLGLHLADLGTRGTRAYIWQTGET